MHRNIMKNVRKFEVEGFELMEKTAVKMGSSSHVVMPQTWLGKKVVIIRIE